MSFKVLLSLHLVIANINNFTYVALAILFHSKAGFSWEDRQSPLSSSFISVQLPVAKDSPRISICSCLSSAIQIKSGYCPSIMQQNTNDFPNMFKPIVLSQQPQLACMQNRLLDTILLTRALEQITPMQREDNLQLLSKSWTHIRHFSKVLYAQSVYIHCNSRVIQRNSKKPFSLKANQKHQIKSQKHFIAFC